MKNFYKLFLIVLFIFGTTSVQAQDENNPWQVSFGMHAVDQEADTNTSFTEFFNVSDNWNVSSPFSMFSVSRYLGSNLSIGVGMSFNSISKYATGFEMPEASAHRTADAMLKYSFGNVLDWGNWEPFVGIGPGYTWMADVNWMTGNFGLGINYWMNERWGLTFQTEYRHSFDDEVSLDEGGSMRWSAGVSIKLGGTKTD
jgi:outer membrane protein W